LLVTASNGLIGVAVWLILLRRDLQHHMSKPASWTVRPTSGDLSAATFSGPR